MLPCFVPAGIGVCPRAARMHACDSRHNRPPMHSPQQAGAPPVRPLPVAAPATGWLRWLPGVRMLRNYRLRWLPSDVIAGLVLTTMLVPVGVAYAEASGVPGIYGLYATIVPLLAYALFGPSRILVLGPDSSLAALILAVVLPLSGGEALRAITLASMVAVVAGVVCILAGVLRLGFITELLSKPMRDGYMNGIALTVLISQLPKAFGITIDGAGPA
jgi:MFS superfamily sulfate permease-like transporter